MNAKQLKNAILQEAIEGRLVPQDPNDEPASVLLQRIRKEKERLVKEGKLKKKDLEEKPISEEEKPFEIPEGWEWVRLGDAMDVRDGTHDTPAYIPHGFPLITGKDFYNGFFELSKTQYISDKDYLEICKRSKVDIGDILFSMIGGNIGSQILITKENYFEMAIKNVALFKQYPSNSIDSKYLSLFLDVRVNHLKSIALGGAQSFVSLKLLRDYLFPLPPLAEQHRIVTKIEELLPKVEEYGKAQEALDKLNAELPERLKKSILQEAITGRLVPQDPNDEPASILLDRIRQEKQRLVKKGKLKKKDLEEKPISEDEKPFEIPESWEWVKLINIGYFMSGQTPKATDLMDIDGGVPYFKVSDMNVKGNELYMNNATLYLKANAKYKLFPKKAIIYPKNGGALLTNKKRILVTDSLVDLNTGAFVSSNELDFEYIFFLFSTIDFSKHYKGTALPTVNMESINKLLFPLPPLSEQHRIVAKLEQLLGEIDKLKVK